MNLSAPTQIVFIIAVVLAIVAILMFLNVFAIAGIPSFWVMTVAFVLLVLGNLLPNL